MSETDMNFTKMHGSGNDFILLETGDDRRDWSSFTVAICDRHFGVGADGLLLVLPSDKADCRMRMFDPDGSEAEACGNGMLCVARYVYDRGLVAPAVDRVTVETVAGVRDLRLIKKAGHLSMLQAGMGKPEFRAAEIPVAVPPDRGRVVNIKSMLSYPVSVGGQDMPLNFVSMGNPHAVYFSSQPVSDFPLSRIGPRVEHLDIFPNRVNFEVARVISRQEIEVRVWERGVGETLACGSGACAVMVAARQHGYVDDDVAVNVPGGTLQLAWDGSGEVLLGGPAEKVFQGEWPE
jgi:diaminopimelate epimerase